MQVLASFHTYSVGAALCAVAALIVAWLSFRRIAACSDGDDKMRELAAAVREGALAFLKTEYKILAVFVILVAALLGITARTGDQLVAAAFVMGAGLSALSGWIGIRTATIANVRTAFAARSCIAGALWTAFSGGMVMGLCVVGLALLGICALWFATGDPGVIFGFGFGASASALFARVGGGNFTKAADAGADSVGKVEAGIVAADPRNPAAVAEHVGDFVGDVAGVGADLFESYVESIVAAMAIGAAAVVAGGRGPDDGAILVMLPLVLAGIGILGSIAARGAVRTEDESKVDSALFNGLIVAAVIFSVGAAGVIWMFGARGGFDPLKDAAHPMWGTVKGMLTAVLSGLVSGVLIGKITENYAARKSRSAREIARQSTTGAAAQLLIQGLAAGMRSCGLPVLCLCVAILASFWGAGSYGIAIAAVGMLATLGISLGVHAYGPVAANAGAIAEKSQQDPSVRKRTDSLSAASNTTAASGKGFAIGAAAMTALALFSAFCIAADLRPGSLDLLDPAVLCGLLMGAMLSFFFSGLTLTAVSRAAHRVTEEVRRQFRETPGLVEGKAKPDYRSCVAISTAGAMQELILPGVLAVASPVLVGALFGREMLGGLLAGSLASGCMLGLFMANAGGALDSARKPVDAGNFGGKGSEAHEAAAIGDSVGDPLKDSSGPALNLLIKLMSIVAVVLAQVLWSRN